MGGLTGSGRAAIATAFAERFCVGVHRRVIFCLLRICDVCFRWRMIFATTNHPSGLPRPDQKHVALTKI